MTTAQTDIETLWHDYHHRIFAYIYKQLRDRDIADDLRSSVYLRAIVAIRNGNGPVANEVAWLFAVARSVIKDHWRAKKYTQLVEWSELPELEDEQADPHEATVREMRNRALRHVVARLPEAQADVVVWRLQGYDLEETSVGIGRTYGATKALMTRAYAKLRNEVEREYAG